MAESAPEKAPAAKQDSSEQHLLPPPTFGKTSFALLVVALVIYAYQVRLLSILVLGRRLNAKRCLDEPATALVWLR